MSKKVVITGASRGIGKMLARGLLENGFEVVMISKNVDRLESARKELEKIGKVTARAADVSVYAEVENALSSLNNLDVLINCAGVLGPTGPLEDNDPEEWESTIKVNLVGTMNCCRAVLPLMKRGKIINLAGGGAAFPRKFLTAYSASKAAVVRFTETLAQELDKVDVNAIAPGVHDTDMVKQDPYTNPKEFADPKRLLDLILFLCSEKSDKITGKFIHYKDPWETFTPDVSSSDEYALRRIDEILLERLKCTK